MSRLPLAQLAAVSLSLTACGPATRAPVVHQFTSGEAGFHTNSFFVDSGSEVVVFDAQFTPELAEEALAHIASVTDSPVRWLVITHPNPDKFNGATVFAEAGATVVASEATAAALPGVHQYKRDYFVSVGMFTEDSYPALPAIDLTFADRLELPVEGLSIELIELGHPGVTTNQTVALTGEAVLVGDLVANQTHAWLEGGIVDGAATPDLDGWRAGLAELHDLVGDSTLVYPGRGPALPASEALPAQIGYLDDAEAETADLLDALEDPTAALAEDGATHYAAIARALADRYPGYAHPYLVEYGVYGLAWQLAGR